jgi:type VI secretion system protein ImpC
VPTVRFQPPDGNPIDPDRPFRVLLIGNYSGSDDSRAGDRPPRIISVDRDDYEDRLAALGSELRISVAGIPIAMTFRALEEFEPDHLYRDLEVFEELRRIRRDLQNPKTFSGAAEALMGAAIEPTPHVAPRPPEEAPLEPEGLLGAALAETESRASEPDSAGRTLAERLAAEIVAPYVTPAPHPRQTELLESVDKSTGRLMSEILHHPDFQRLESTWRSVDFLVRRLDTDSNLKLYLMDTTRAALDEGLSPADELERSPLFRRLVDETVGTPGADPWSLWVVDDRFGTDGDDLELLGRLAKAATAAGAGIVTGATESLIGGATFATSADPEDWPAPSSEAISAWTEFRGRPESACLGFVLPRFLHRLPYGPRTRPVEAFAYEEHGDDFVHEHYAWGSGGIIAALALGTAFTRDGWAFDASLVSRIDGLPLHVVSSDGESRAASCAEALLTDRAAGTLADLGLTPLRWVRGEDAIQIGPIRSVHASGATLFTPVRDGGAP